jgi:5,10-methenyltetrahydrofolate synthetase
MSERQKKILREEMKRILSHLDPRWIKAASKELCANLSRLIDDEIGERAKHILAWTAYFPGEVDLSSFISMQVEKREVFLPRLAADRSLSFISIGRNWTEMMEPGGGIPQPGAHTGRLFEPADAPETAAIVPALAFDAHGNRLGRGGMVYERFFHKAGIHDAITVGAAWSLQMLAEVPLESHDITVDWICNEEGLIRTKASQEDMLGE